MFLLTNKYKIMKELLIKEEDKRVIFPHGSQQAFLLQAIKKLGVSTTLFTEAMGVNKRTFSDWQRKKYSLPLSVLKKITDLTDIKKPKDIKIKNRYWYIYKGGSVGGLAVYKKYGMIGGDPEYRKKKWREWWNREGKYNENLITAAKPIHRPKHSQNLAEFVGIMMGDGGITKLQTTITLNAKTDKDYVFFVQNLIKKLFKINPSIYTSDRSLALSIVVSRKRLVEFCDSIGLKTGNKLKQGLDIPKWVKERQSFANSCARGLMDTDGCIFNECHRIKQKYYCYPRMSFVSHSKQLRLSVLGILKKIDLSPKIRNNRSVQIERRADILRYFEIIGTSNPKHLKRFKLFLNGGVGSGYPKWS